MYYIDESNRRQHIYPTYGRQFAAYRWYKPIITAVMFAVIYIALYVVLLVAAGAVGSAVSPDVNSLTDAIMSGYDDMDLANSMQNVINLGGNALMIPALFLAALIVRDRPVSSYSSSRGGWSHKIFWRIMPVAFLCKAIPILAEELIINDQLSNYQMRFTLVSFLLVTVLGPLQCISEEYIFRGLFMQTLGSWVRLPVIAVVVQAAVFMAAHPYNNIGKAAIFVSGLTFGLAAWICRGIEASSALHVVNNMTIFYLNGLNLAEIGTDVSMLSLIEDSVSGVVFIVILFVLSRKTDWFSKVRKDDVAIADQKYEERKAAKIAARKEVTFVVNEIPSGDSGAEARTYEGGKHFRN